MLFKSVAFAALVGMMGVEAAGKPVSKDARCGNKFGGATCQGSRWGNCCSQYGYCGSNKDYCDAANRCQVEFGTCSGKAASSTVGRTTLATSVRSPSPVLSSATPSPLSSSAVSSSPNTCSAITVTESASSVTVTESGAIITVTQSASTEISTLSQTITFTETSSVTLTETSTQTTSETATVTEVSSTTLTESTTIPTTISTTVTEVSSTTLTESTTVPTTISTTLTVTSTATQEPACSATQALQNPSFETATIWAYNPNTNIASGLIRGSSGSANPPRDGTYLVQSGIDRVLDVNSGHRLTQAVRVCPGKQYKFSLWLRTITSSASGRPTLVDVFINGVRILTSTALTVDQGWTEFTGTWTADAAGTGAAAVQIVTYCNSPVTSSSGTYSYLWMDLATLSAV